MRPSSWSGYFSTTGSAAQNVSHSDLKAKGRHRVGLLPRQKSVVTAFVSALVLRAKCAEQQPRGANTPHDQHRQQDERDRNESYHRRRVRRKELTDESLETSLQQFQDLIEE